MKKPMTLVVDPWHWLDESGEFPRDNLRIRRQIIRIARFIEYGGPLHQGGRRETLVECKRRPGRKACLGLVWVFKTKQDEIIAHCPECETDEAVINNWQDTLWADGMMEPVPTVDEPDPMELN